MSFHLLRTEPDATALANWATRNRVMSSDGDYGYALHALMTAAFGDLAPRPFRYLGGKNGLLAYTAAEMDELRLRAGLAAPDVARALGLDAMDSRPFPTVWPSNQRLGFEVRVRPVVRTTDGREQDVFLHTVGKQPQSEPLANPNPLVNRQAVYVDWLARQFGTNEAAVLENAVTESFALTRVYRRGRSDQAGKRKTTQTAGPDVVFKGVLRVGEPDSFSNLLARGLGRHRAFGFGMLLLRSATQC